MKLLTTTVLLFGLIQTAQASEFALYELPEGIKIALPAHWEILSKDTRRNIRAATEAVAEKSELRLREATNILHVNATPKPTGAIIRVTVGPPPDFDEQEVRSLTLDELKEMGERFDTQLRSTWPAGGPELLESFTPRVESVAGIQSIAWTYRRRSTTGIGTWLVTQFKIPARGMLVEFTTSYRESDDTIWKPIIRHVTDSLQIPR
jgi:hypothetical protein